MNTQEYIDELVSRYSPSDVELFRTELERLVALAGRDAFKEFGEKLLNRTV